MEKFSTKGGATGYPLSLPKIITYVKFLYKNQEKTKKRGDFAGTSRYIAEKQACLLSFTSGSGDPNAYRGLSPDMENRFYTCLQAYARQVQAKGQKA